MSGIVGMVSQGGKADISCLNKALDLIQHRGPDGRSVISGKWGMLGGNVLRTSND